jgi:hypothetical protein
MESTGLARAAAAVFLVVAFVLALLFWRSDLVRPGDIGTDASNYYAAGLRMIEGGELYALSPGDRPVPADNPPFWSVPLLSPPPVAVAWTVLAIVLPGAVAMYGWWLIGLIGAMGTAVVGWRARDWRALLFVAVVSPTVAMTAISGNLNAWLIPAYAAVFALARVAPGRRSIVVLALIAGTAAAFKLSPVILVWWLLVQGRRRAAVGAVVVTALWFAAGAAVAGPGALASYLEISRGTAQVGATPLSAPEIALALGVPADLAALTPFACLLAAAVGIVLLRGRPVASSVVVILGTIYATPVIRVESFALLVAVVAGDVRLEGVRWPGYAGRHGRRVALAGLAGVAVVAFWIGSSPRSSLVVQNRTETPIVVRFGVAGQAATFGYRVEAGDSARGFGALPGGFTGPVLVFRSDCTEVTRAMTPSAGGMLVLDEGGSTRFEPDPGTDTPFAPYVADCAP